jgi:hypothetical protein
MAYCFLSKPHYQYTPVKKELVIQTCNEFAKPFKMTTTRYLIIDKKNEVYLKIEADADIRRELGEYFTFEVPGFKFMPQYRNRVWDGKIRLFSYATGQIYAGLISLYYRLV